MTYTLRQYDSPSDYWRAREFFRALRISSTRPSGHWHVGAFDFWRWHWLENVAERPPTELRYWETAEGEIEAVLVQGDPGVCHPMADPRTATEPLYHAMLDVAERDFTTVLQDGRRVTFAWADVMDDCLNRVLEARGYELHEGGHTIEYHGWHALSTAPRAKPAPAGYVIRSMRDGDELPARSLASWRSYHPGEPDEGADPTGGWYRNIQRAPLYRRDLNVVAIAEDADIAAFATCYFDDVSRTGVFVLISAVPPHQERGLEEAVLSETLRRLHTMGAIGAYLSWYESDPGTLYESVGFADQEVSRAWRRFT